MKISKILIAALAVFVFSMLVGMVTCEGFFSWVYKLEPTSVWKEFNFPLMVIGEIFVSFIFVLVYALVNKGIEAGNKVKKGLLYGLIVYALSSLNGAVPTYTYMNVADAVIIYWIVWGLIVYPIKGLIVSAIYE